MKASTYYLQGAHDFKAITHDKNRYAIARAAKYAMSDSWQAKAYAKGLNDVGYEYRQLIGTYGPLKAMNDAVWCYTGIDAHKAMRESSSAVIRSLQAVTDARISAETAECTERTRQAVAAMNEAREATKEAPKVRLYHLVVINERTGAKVYLTAYPMTHAECCVMKSKNNRPNRIIFEEI